MNIKNLKFEYGGHFDFKYRPEFSCTEGNSKKRHVIYAHCVDKEIVYIGETSNTFYKRMYYYCNHKGATNVRVRSYLKEKFLQGKVIETFVYKPEDVIIEGLTINPYVGIEQKLINDLNPILNRKNVLTGL